VSYSVTANPANDQLWKNAPTSEKKKPSSWTAGRGGMCAHVVIATTGSDEMKRLGESFVLLG